MNIKTPENRKHTTSGIMDEEFLVLVRKNWRSLPQLFRVRLVENFYRNIGSIRKTAKLLGLGRSTVHHYLKYYRHSNIASLSHREQAQTLKEFLNEKDTLLPIADPNMDNGTGNHHLLTGDEASLTQC